MTDREPRRVSRRWIDAWERSEWPDEDGRTEREPLRVRETVVDVGIGVLLCVGLVALAVPPLLLTALVSHEPGTDSSTKLFVHMVVFAAAYTAEVYAIVCVCKLAPHVPWGKVAVAVALLAFLGVLLLSAETASHMPLALWD